MPGSPATTQRWCLLCGDLGGVDFINNVALFLPLGLALRRRYALPTSLLAGVALSLAVEVLQWRVVPGRDASLGDLTANTVGTWLGSLVWSVWPLVRRPSHRAAWTGLLFSLALFTGVWAGSSWAMRPAPIRWNHYLAFNSRSADVPRFEGSVERVRLFDVPVSEYDVINAIRFGAAYGLGQIDLRARIGGHAPDGGAVVLRIASHTFVPAEVTARGTDLVFRARRNAAILKLRSPVVTFRRALSDSASEFRFQAREGDIGITRAASADSSVVVQALTPARSWALFGPIEVRDATLGRILDFVWPALLLFAVMYFAAHLGRSIVAAAAVWTLGVVSMVMGFGPPLPLQGLAGLLVGAWAGVRLAAGCPVSNDLEAGRTS